MKIRLDLSAHGAFLARLRPAALGAYVLTYADYMLTGAMSPVAASQEDAEAFTEVRNMIALRPDVMASWEADRVQRAAVSEIRRVVGAKRAPRRKVRLKVNHGSQTEYGPSDVVFQAWQEIMQHPRAKLDKKLRTLIQDRVADGFTVADLCDAIKGCSNSPYHMGVNEGKTRYDSLELILRNAAHVNKFLALADRKPVQVTVNTMRNLEHAREFLNDD